MNTIIQLKPIHGNTAPLWQIHDLKEFSPVPCDFKLNDKVISTNDYGVSFDCVVIGFAEHDRFYGCFIHTIVEGGTWEGSAGWCASNPKSLKLKI